MLLHTHMMSAPSLLSFFKQALKPLMLGTLQKSPDGLYSAAQTGAERRDTASGSCSFFNFIFSTPQLSPQSITELGVHCCTSHSCSNI